jgi:hypothetical protein
MTLPDWIHVPHKVQNLVPLGQILPHVGQVTMSPGSPFCSAMPQGSSKNGGAYSIP